MMKMRVVSVDICNVYKYTLVDGGGDHGGGGDDDDEEEERR